MTDELVQQDYPLARNEVSGPSNWTISSIVSSMEKLADNRLDQDSEQEIDHVALMKMVAVKDRQAFETLYDATVQRVFSLAIRITRQHALAEEVVSDVFFQVWQQGHRFSPTRGSVIAWLCVLCRSRALDAIRRNNTAVRKAEIRLDSVAEPEDSSEPPDILQSMEQGTAIHAALSKLTDEQRQLVALAYFRGYSHTEIATITALPLGTVKTNLRRSLMKLKELMSNMAAMGGGFDE